MVCCFWFGHIAKNQLFFTNKGDNFEKFLLFCENFLEKTIDVLSLNQYTIMEGAVMSSLLSGQLPTPFGIYQRVNLHQNTFQTQQFDVTLNIKKASRSKTRHHD